MHQPLDPLPERSLSRRHLLRGLAATGAASALGYLSTAEAEAAQERAVEVAGLAGKDALPNPLPAMQDPQTFAEVMSDGRIVTATGGLDGRNGFDLPEQDVGEVQAVEVPRLPVSATGPFRVVARGVSTPTGPMTVFIAVSVHDVEHTLSVATRIGTIGLSLLVLVLATVMWLAIGRTLAPVEAISARADAITGQSLDSRVPVPPHHDEIGRLARTVNRCLGACRAASRSNAGSLPTPLTSCEVPSRAFASSWRRPETAAGLVAGRATCCTRPAGWRSS